MITRRVTGLLPGAVGAASLHHVDVPAAPTEAAPEPEPRAGLFGQLPDGVPASVAALALRERIYGSIACLSTLLVISAYPASEHPWTSVFDVLIATGGLWTASVLAEVVAHIGAHGRTPHGRELRHLGWVSGQIMAASAVPVLLLVLAGLRVMSSSAAVWSGVWVLVGEMGVFAFLAVRRTSLSRWRKLVLIAALVALGLVVVLLKTLAH